MKGVGGVTVEGVRHRRVLRRIPATGTPLSAPRSLRGTYTVVANLRWGAPITSRALAPLTFKSPRPRPPWPLRLLRRTSTATRSGFRHDHRGGFGRGKPGVSRRLLTYYAGIGHVGCEPGHACRQRTPGSTRSSASFAGSRDYSAVQSATVSFTIGPGTATIRADLFGRARLSTDRPSRLPRSDRPGYPERNSHFRRQRHRVGNRRSEWFRHGDLDHLGPAFGSHSITATYNGDANLLGVQSKSASAAVSQSGTTVVLVPVPVLKKKKVKSEVLTAEIEPISPWRRFPGRHGYV